MGLLTEKFAGAREAHTNTLVLVLFPLCVHFARHSPEGAVGQGFYFPWRSRVLRCRGQRGCSSRHGHDKKIL